MLGQQEDNSVLEFGAFHWQCTVLVLNQSFRYAFFVFLQFVHISRSSLSIWSLLEVLMVISGVVLSTFINGLEPAQSWKLDLSLLELLMRLQLTSRDISDENLEKINVAMYLSSFQSPSEPSLW
jgi:hypothetical protein